MLNEAFWIGPCDEAAGLRPRSNDETFQAPPDTKRRTNSRYGVVPEESAVGGYHHMINYC